MKKNNNNNKKGTISSSSPSSPLLLQSSSFLVFSRTTLIRLSLFIIWLFVVLVDYQHILSSLSLSSSTTSTSSSSITTAADDSTSTEARQPQHEPTVIVQHLDDVDDFDGSTSNNDENDDDDIEDNAFDDANVVDMVEEEEQEDAASAIVKSDLDESEVEDHVPVIKPRAFTWSHGRPVPCSRTEKIVFIKPHKVGSSSAASITLRIARNVAIKNKRREMMIAADDNNVNDHDNDNMSVSYCPVKYHHGPASKKIKNFIPEQSFMWTIIREPTSRLISSFYFFRISRTSSYDDVSTTTKNVTDETLMSALKKGAKKDYYHKYLSPIGYSKEKGDNPIHIVNKVLDDYNFIGITERMDESAVVLMMLLDLDFSDILHLDSKLNGGYDDGGGQDGKCTYIQKGYISPTVQQYMDSNDIKHAIRHDMMMYNAVNQSLDITIDKLGRTKFEENLHKYRDLSTRARTICTPKIKFPCTINGTRIPDEQTDCIYGDLGCGFTCLDEITL